MPDISDTADVAFRDFNTANSPATGAHRPEKAAIRSLFKIVEELSKSGLKNGDDLEADYDLLQGVLRKSATNPEEWGWLNDGAHQTVGFDPDPNLVDYNGNRLGPQVQGGRTLYIPLKVQTDALKVGPGTVGVDKVGSVIVAGDEVTQRYGMEFGGRVQRNAIVLEGSMAYQICGAVRWNSNSNQFDCTTSGLESAGTVTAAWDGTRDVLVVDHGWCPGWGLNVQPWLGGVDANAIWDAHLFQTPSSPTQFEVAFFRKDTGARYRGSETPGMTFKFEKLYTGPVYFNDALGFDQIPWTASDAGNLFVLGVMANDR